MLLLPYHLDTHSLGWIGGVLASCFGVDWGWIGELFWGGLGVDWHGLAWIGAGRGSNVAYETQYFRQLNHCGKLREQGNIYYY